MAIPRHLEEAVARLQASQTIIHQMRTKKTIPEDVRRWLEALSDACAAITDIESYNNESVHEKLHRLADHMRLKDFS